MSYERQGDRFARSIAPAVPTLSDELMRGIDSGDSLSRRDASHFSSDLAAKRARVHVMSIDLLRAKALVDLLSTAPEIAACTAGLLPAPLGDMKAAALNTITNASDTLVIIDSDEAAGEMAGLARRLSKSRVKYAVAFVGSRTSGASIDLVLRAGSRGYLPKQLDAAAMVAAVRYVLAGQKFRPYAHDHEEPAAATPSKVPAVRKPANGYTDQALTGAELEVFRLVAQHLTDREIAEARNTQRGTVCIQVQNIKRKLGCKRRSHLIEIYWRLYELDDRSVQHALSGGAIDTGWLLELMHAEVKRRGQTLFHQGDAARRMYYIESGEVSLPEIGVSMKSGELLGEIGIFAPDNKRTHTAVCFTDVKLRYLDAAQVWRFYQLKPQFAIQMQCLIMRRLLADISRLQRPGGASTGSVGKLCTANSVARA